MRTEADIQFEAIPTNAALLVRETLDRQWQSPLREIAKEVTIWNQLGLHMRPAAMFVRTACQYRSQISVTKNGTEVDGASILGLMVLCAARGDKLRISIRGADAADAMRAIERLIQSGFEEE